MDSLRNLYSSLAENIQALDNSSSKIRSRIGDASYEELETLFKHLNSHRGEPEDNPKIVRMALQVVSNEATSKIRALKLWVVVTILLMSFLVGLLLSGLDG